MLEENRVDNILNEISEIVKPKRSKMGFTVRCPVCGDSQKSSKMARLHVDWFQKYETWVCTCYNGGCPFHSGDIYSLYAEVKGLTYSEAKKFINEDKYDTNSIKKRLAKKINKDVGLDDSKIDISVLTECLSITTVTDDRIENRFIDKLKDFMKGRLIPKEYPCFVAYKGRYKGRYIIPVIINGKLEYFQGRSIFDQILPKYLNPKVLKSSIILNRDKFDRNKSIIITEGIIDAYMIEHHQGTSCLGAYMSDALIKPLMDMTDQNIILCFDNPLIDNSGREEILKFIEESQYSKIVKYFFVNRRDFKDLNDLKVMGFTNIYDYVVDNSYSYYNILIKLKFL